VTTDPAEIDAWVGGFRLTGRIGGGAVGDVYDARREGDDIAVAVKLLHAGAEARPMARAVFYDEIRAIAALDHPGIVRILDVGELQADEAVALGRVAGAPWFAMERLTGPAPRVPADGADEVAATVREVLDALAHVHARGVLHRDIKPSNLRRAFDGGPLRLVDFGLASLVADGPARRAFTAIWAAPEQTADGAERDEGPWTDLYAVGALAYAMATGAPPRANARDALAAHRARDRAPRPKFLFPMPPRFARWLDRMLAPRARDRFQNAADARAAFEQIAAVSLPAPRASLMPSGPERHAASLRASRQPRVVGRDNELRTLARALQSAVTDHAPHAVVLRAPRGTGVSRTVGAFVEHVLSSGAAIALEAAHDADASADEALRHALARHLGVAGTDTSLVEDRLRIRYGDRLDDATRPALARMICGVESPQTGGAERRVDRFGTIASMVSVEARTRPVVFVVQDAQWGPESIDLVRWWQTTGPAVPILFILTATSEDLEDRPALARMLDSVAAVSDTEPLDLRPLADDDIRDLLSTWVDVPAQVVDRIVQRSDGRPRHAIDLVRAWLVDDIDDIESEADLADLWLVRVNAIVGEHGAAGRDALTMAGMMGRTVSVSLWRAACEAAGRPFDESWLTDLVRADAIHIRDDEIFIRRDLLRRTLHRDAKARGVLDELHSGCADAMNQLDRREERYTRRAHHLLCAGRLGEGLPLQFEAAEAAWRRGDRATALERIERFQTDDDGRASLAALRVEVHALLAYLYRTDGRMSDAEAEADAAVELAEQVGDPFARARALRASATVHNAGGRFAESETALTEAARLLEGIDAPRERGRVHAELGHMARRHGDLDRAEAEMGRARQEFLAIDDILGVGDAYRGLADIAWARGAMDAAWAFLIESRRYFERAANPLRLAVCDNSIGENLRARGRHAEAERFYRRALTVIAQRARANEPFVRLNIALCLLESDRPLDAHDELARAVAPTFVHAHKMLHAIASSVRAATLVALDRLEEAAEEVAVADAAFEATGVVERDSERCLRRAADGLETGGYSAAAALARSRADAMAARLAGG